MYSKPHILKIQRTIITHKVGQAISNENHIPGRTVIISLLMLLLQPTEDRTPTFHNL